MNWPLFWALVMAFGVVIGNIMLLKHAAKFKLPPFAAKDKTPNGDNDTASVKHDVSIQTSAPHGQTPNTPE